MYGGIADFKRREIPNLVPIMSPRNPDSIMGLSLCPDLTFLLMALILWIASKISSTVPGGDFKLLTTMAFCPGLACTGWRLDSDRRVTMFVVITLSIRKRLETKHSALYLHDIWVLF